MSVPAGNRVETLARRVTWLDRYRRAIAITLAVALWFLCMYELESVISPQWASIAGATLSTLSAITTWWLVEVALAWLTALWETEHDQLVRDRGLPRAQLIVRK